MKAVSSWALLVAAWIIVPAAQLAAGFVAAGPFERPLLLFWAVVIAAIPCVVVAIVMLVEGFRTARAETALLGSFLLAVSSLPLAHGVLTPGVLYGPNPGATTAVQLAVPLGGLALMPFIKARSTPVNRVARRWPLIVSSHVALVLVVIAVFLTNPHLLPAARAGSSSAIGLAIASSLVCLAMSYRHQRLAVIARDRRVAGVAIGFVFVGSAPIMSVAGDPYGVGFWLAHVLDVGGVLLVGVLALVAYRRTETLDQLLAPIEVATPLNALELGLEPIVHEWVAALDAKDQQTRDHVVRTAQLAVHVAIELRLPPAQVRLTGIGAILHDVGKLDMPNEILTKPGRLTDAERAIIETHPTTGAARLAASPVLADAAEIVASHHERIDGDGYPEGLQASEIPLGARIVAACDAYDAMTNTRHYRTGMTLERAASILREHAGAQWDADVVDALLRVVRDRPADGETALETVGLVPPSASAMHWPCQDALPPELNLSSSAAATARTRPAAQTSHPNR